MRVFQILNLRKSKFHYIIIIIIIFYNIKVGNKMDWNPLEFLG